MLDSLEHPGSSGGLCCSGRLLKSHVDPLRALDRRSTNGALGIATTLKCSPAIETENKVRTWLEQYLARISKADDALRQSFLARSSADQIVPERSGLWVSGRRRRGRPKVKV